MSRIVVVVNDFFKDSKAVCSVSVQTHLTPFWVNLRRGADKVAKFGMKRPQYCSMPRNQRIFEAFLGMDDSLTAATLEGLGEVPLFENT